MFNKKKSNKQTTPDVSGQAPEAPAAPAAPAVELASVAAPAPVQGGQAPVQGGQAKAGPMGLVMDVLLIAAVSTVVSVAVWKFAPVIFSEAPQAPEIPVALINIDELAREQILGLGALVRTGAIEPSEMPFKSAEFGKALIDQVQGYSNKEGRLIMRAESVVASPGYLDDLTEQVRKTLQASGAMVTPEKKPVLD